MELWEDKDVFRGLVCGVPQSFGVPFLLLAAAFDPRNEIVVR
jgi:hypothetical protein